MPDKTTVVLTDGSNLVIDQTLVDTQRVLSLAAQPGGQPFAPFTIEGETVYIAAMQVLYFEEG